MGACFSKIVNKVAFEIHCASTWVYEQKSYLNRDSTLSESTLNNNSPGGSVSGVENEPTLNGNGNTNLDANSDYSSVTSSEHPAANTTPQITTNNTNTLTTSKEYLLLGSDRGIIALDKENTYFNNFEDNEMTQVHYKKCTWMDIFRNTLVTISGNTKDQNKSCLWQHNLVDIYQKSVMLTPNNLPPQDGSTFQRLLGVWVRFWM